MSVLADLWTMCYRHGVPRIDEAVDAYLAVGTLNANDRLVLDGLAEASQSAASQLNFLRSRIGAGRGLQVAWLAYQNGIGGIDPPGVN